MMEHLNFYNENFLKVTQDLERISLFREKKIFFDHYFVLVK